MNKLPKLLLAAALAGACLQAQGQGFPSQPIKLIVPFAPGGGVDIVGRTIAENANRQNPGVSVVVENRTGAGGNVGSTSVAKSAPDGYTLLVASNSNSYNNFLYSNMQYDAARDLQAVMQIGRVPMVLLVSPSIPPKNVAEVIALAKAKPGTLNFGSGGNGTAEHMVYELFKRRTGIDALHIPYRGGAQVYTDLIGGQIQLMFNNQLGATQYIRSGQLRAAGITGMTRSSQLPDLPTFEEQGIRNFTASVWWGLMGPAGMPAPVVARLNQIFNAAINSPEMKARLETLGAQPVGGSAEQFAAHFASERATWQQVIKDANIKVE
jgi:tripartite-type tricarboxylate transporter receptor subunit TctC